MKRLLIVLTIMLSVLAISGCKKENKAAGHAAKLVGEWKCTPEEIDAEIYVCFDADGSFELYQKIGDGRHRRYTGVWEIEGKMLSGKYSDGSSWGSSYEIRFINAETLVLTAQNGSAEEHTYFREPVPSEVREGCLEVRSDGILNSQPQYLWL